LTDDVQTGGSAAVIDSLVAVSLHARDVPSPIRERARGILAQGVVGRGLLVATCHRVDAYTVDSDFGGDPLRATGAIEGARVLRGEGVVRHALETALGLDSVLVGEDQVLHQIRTALREAADRGGLEPSLARLFQIALREGRRARSWREGPPRSLADIALERLAGAALNGRRVLVVGAGIMGRLAAQTALRRRASVELASRDPARGATVARGLGIAARPFDPGPEVAEFDLVVIALRGPWVIGRATADALLAAETGVADLSAPPALPEPIRERLGERALSIDDLALPAEGGDERFRRRLERACAAAAAEYRRWIDGRTSVAAGRLLVERAGEARQAELEHLFRRLPDLDGPERVAIAAMADHLTERLLREPLSRLADDPRGERRRAALELFDL
jgi:glutamyl-tRNA reductase